MRLMERDKLIFACVAKFNFLLGRHIKMLFFDGTRACDRRLKLLCENEYINRRKILYGVPSLYSLTHKGRKAVNASIKDNKIRVEQIQHDIAVIDTLIFIMNKFKVNLSDVTTEKQLHQLDGFGERRHHPDFIFVKDNKTYSVEVELSLKAKTRLEKIIENNFMEYNRQFWVVPDNQVKILKILEISKLKYTDIAIISLERIEGYVKHI